LLATSLSTELPNGSYEGSRFSKAYNSALMASSFSSMKPVFKILLNNKKKKLTLNIDSAALSGGQKQYFLWPPLQAAPSISTFCYLFTLWL
jgi:hypothetical protein